MPPFPNREEQIRLTHAELIHLVVNACHDPAQFQPQLSPVLQQAKTSGWDTLVDRINAVLAGRRDESLLNGLDEEDSVIIQSILKGIQNPETLPALNQQADPAMAAPGLAHMIHAAGRGDAQALQGISVMAEQMVQAQGDLRLLGGIMHKLVNGERDPDVLCKGMGRSGEQLVLSILDELNRLAVQ
jgi:hypothetical protein